MERNTISEWFDMMCTRIVSANNASVALGFNSLSSDEMHAEQVLVSWFSSGCRAQCGGTTVACEELVQAINQLRRKVEATLTEKIKTATRTAGEHAARLQTAEAALAHLRDVATPL